MNKIFVMYKNYPFRRYKKTMLFLKKHIAVGSTILDLGVANPLSILMKEHGYLVINTQGENLDEEYLHLNEVEADVVTSFEVFEHMFVPYNFLMNTTHKRIMISVPLKVWFAKAYWNKNDERDRHYHEFEPRQLDYLLEKTGWKIIDREIWHGPPGSVRGIRPFVRFFYPTYYIVYCEKSKS